MTYELSIVRDMIRVTGAPGDVRPLMRISGSSLSESQNADLHDVHVPMSRFNFMAVEAIQIPTQTTEEYRDFRRHFLTASPSEMSEAHEAIRQHSVLTREDFLQHQLEFLGFARRLDAIFNASEQGTGKTRMTLGLLETAPQPPLKTLIVAPKSVMREWSKEFLSLELDGIHTGIYRNGHEYHYSVDMVVLDSGSTREKAESLRSILPSPSRSYVVVNYEAISGMEDALLSWNWDAVVFDESWKIKSPHSKMTQVALNISQVARRVILLSGTPVGNTAADLFTQCVALGIESTPETYKQFSQRFCDVEEIMINDHPVTVRTGIQDPAALVAFMDPTWYRATKQSTLDLPPKINTTVELDLPENVRGIYDRIILGDRDSVHELLGITSLAGMATRLQRITGGFLKTPEGYTEIESPKLDYIKQHLVTTPEETRVIIWCKYTSEIDRIERELREVLPSRVIRKVYLSVDGDELESIKYDFNSKQVGKCSIIVAQIQKLCAGHNLQGCDLNIYFSNSWSYIDRAQSEDRSHRMGRVGSVTNIDLVCRHTIDEQILAALSAKQNLLQRLALTTSFSRTRSRPNTEYHFEYPDIPDGDDDWSDEDYE